MTVDITLFLPELFQIAIVLALFLQSVLKPGHAKNGGAWLPLAAAINLVVAGFSLESRGIILWEAYQIDGLSQFFKFAVALGFVIAVLTCLAERKTIRYRPGVRFFRPMTGSRLKTPSAP